MKKYLPLVLTLGACSAFAVNQATVRLQAGAAAGIPPELNHGYIGCPPTPRHFVFGVDETWPGTNFLEPQASVKILDVLVGVATKLKGTRR